MQPVKYLPQEKDCMRKVNKILVPIDFSDESARALRHGWCLAMETHAELVALHAIEKTDDNFIASVAMLEGSPLPINEFPTVPLDVMARERSLDLWNFIAQNVDVNHQSRITRQVRIGRWLTAMMATIHEEAVTLVVIKLREGGMLFSALKVLKLIKMIRRLPCPVLLDTSSSRDQSGPGKGLLWLQTVARETPA